MHRLTLEQARRIAVRAQWLDARPAGSGRKGPSYDPDDLVAALEEDHTLFELGSYIRPMSDVGMHLAGAADWPHEGEYPGPRGHTWLEDNEPFRVDVLERWRATGR